MSTDQADVVIVGAGLAGGITAAALTAAGLRVVCLEQGDWPDYDKARADFPDYEVTADRYWARDPNSRRAEADYPVDDTASDISALMWNGVGGGTVLYSAKWHRMTPSDFRVRSHDGVADDWPLSYEDLEPYYVEAERQLGVSGLAGNPAYPAGEGPPNPPVPIRAAGRRMAKALNELGWHWWPGSNAISTRDYRMLSPCRQHGTCMSGCPERAKASTDITHWPAAVDGGADLRTGARVTRVLVRGDQATGVEYVDRDGALHKVDARAVIMCANGVGTPRTLLMSATSEHPDGLANSSGLLGKRLMMHPFGAVAGIFDEDLATQSGSWGQQIQTMHFYESDPARGFVRGAKWGLQPTGGPLGLTRSYPWGQSPEPMWFESFHDTLKGRLGHAPMWSIVAEDLPDERNTVTLASDRADSDGLPGAKLTYAVDENSKRLMDFHIARAVESFEVAGAKEIIVGPHVRASGWHLMGTAVMGDDPASSVTDRFGRTHDIPNLFIFDSSTWVTSGGVNPAATQAALALWSSDAFLRQGRLSRTERRAGAAA
ncbi:GMC family oxidoreductase [Saccharopolyspora sp. NPDC002686]|uniref:GMC family oxidoreductase n=1 Tax=Saccharopolyspora sp. NPDC002686 TaxID=3154541 RepID=UPI003333310B